MAQGRPAQLQRLYELQLGDSMDLHPPEGVPIAAFVKRLKQVSYKYLREGKAYRFEVGEDHVRAIRVPVGSHKKMSYLQDLELGERHFIAASLSWEAKKALIAQVGRVNGTGKGYFLAEIDQDGIYVRRWRKPTGPTWNIDRKLPWPTFLDLKRD